LFHRNRNFNKKSFFFTKIVIEIKSHFFTKIEILINGRISPTNRNIRHQKTFFFLQKIQFLGQTSKFCQKFILINPAYIFSFFSWFFSIFGEKKQTIFVTIFIYFFSFLFGSSLSSVTKLASSFLANQSGDAQPPTLLRNFPTRKLKKNAETPFFYPG